MRKIYKDYVITTERVYSPLYGNGVQATFYVPKINGTKSNIQVYQYYGLRLGEIFDRACKIIDAGL